MFAMMIGLIMSAILFVVLFISKLFGLSISWLMVFLLPPLLSIGVFCVTILPFILLAAALTLLAK